MEPRRRPIDHGPAKTEAKKKGFFRGKWGWKQRALVYSFLAAMGLGGLYIHKHPEKVWRAKEVMGIYPWRAVEITRDGKKTTITEPPNFPYINNSQSEDLCSMYAGYSMKRLFGINYLNSQDRMGDAYAVAKRHRSVWHAERTRDPNSYLKVVKPGMLLGVYNPSSSHNDEPGFKQAGYTHIMGVVGFSEGVPMVVHRIKRNQYLEPLWRALLRFEKDGKMGEVREVIAPKE